MATQHQDTHGSGAQATKERLEAERNADKHPVPDSVNPPADSTEQSIAKSAARDELSQLRIKVIELHDMVSRVCARFGMS